MAVNKKKEARTANNPGRESPNEDATSESNHLLQSVIDASLSAIGYLKPVRNESGRIIDFTCVFANKKAVKYAGGIGMVNNKLCDLFPDIRESIVFQNYVKALEEKVVRDFEFHYKNEKFDLWFRVIAVKLDGGLLVSAENITLQKKAEKELSAQHNLLKQAEELAQAGSWEYDVNTGAFFWSDGMYRLFEMKKGDVVVPAVYIDYAVEPELAVAQKIVDAIEKQYEPFEEMLHIRVDGSVKALKIKGAPLKNDKGQPEKVLGVDVDVTVVEQSEKKIKELNDSLFAMNKELNSLNSELKNFNTITGSNYSETLRHIYINLEAIVTNDARVLSDSSRANLRRAQSSIQRLKLHTNDINKYLQLYDIGINKQMINPNTIIEHVISGMKGKIEDAQANITIHELPSFPADPLLFSHLMTHLIDNAIKFRKLVVEPVIKIHYSHADELNAMPMAMTNTAYMIIIVSDNGIGFQEEEMDKIFELFYQVPTQAKTKGSGMGLAICKKIMEMHGGFIAAEGQRAAGASFQCYFPL